MYNLAQRELIRHTVAPWPALRRKPMIAVRTNRGGRRYCERMKDIYEFTEIVIEFCCLFLFYYCRNTACLKKEQQLLCACPLFFSSLFPGVEA